MVRVVGMRPGFQCRRSQGDAGGPCRANWDLDRRRDGDGKRTCLPGNKNKCMAQTSMYAISRQAAQPGNATPAGTKTPAYYERGGIATLWVIAAREPRLCLETNRSERGLRRGTEKEGPLTR